MSREVRVAVFRPDDDRLRGAVSLLESLGATPVPDPMLEVRPTGAMPGAAKTGSDGIGDGKAEGDADSPEFVVFTSKTGAELVADAGWEPADGVVVCAIGDSTAAALREVGYRVDRIPEEFSSTGLVRELADDVAGARVEVARSDHGSDVLLDGLREAGADVHETVLYRLVRPEGSGESAEMAAAGDLEGALFTSSLTVAHFLDAAAERGVREDAVVGLNGAVVGVIGEPTREAAEAQGIEVDVVPGRADFEELACTVVERAAPTYRG